MNFACTDEQLLLRDTVRSLLERECPPAIVRAAWSNRDAAAIVWKLLDEIGVFDPSLTDLDLVLVFEESGRAALPGPFVERAVGADIVEAPSAMVDHSVWWTGEGANDRAALGAAAQLVGLGVRMIEMTVDYVKERTQFGAPVGSYQAVKHHLASAHVKIEYARPVVYRAAYAIAHDEPDRRRDVSFAKVYAGDAAGAAARAALQCHGAIGYSFEYDLHLWMKRAWVLQTAWGTAAFHRNRVADAVIG